MTIHAFLENPVFTDPDERITGTAESRPIPELGVADNKLLSFHENEIRILDKRTSYRSYTYLSDSYIPRDTNTFLNDPVNQGLDEATRHQLIIESVYCDSLEYAESLNVAYAGETDANVLPSGPATKQRVDNGSLLIDESKLTPDQLSLIEDLGSAWNSVFELIDYLTFGHNSGKTMTEIDQYIDDQGLCAHYTDDSLVMSPLHTDVMVYGIGTIGTAFHRMIPRWVEFEISYTSGADTYTERLRIWTDREFYKEKYPFYDVIEVIPPFSAEKLFNPALLGDTIDELIADSDSDSALIVSTVKDSEQTGAITCPSRLEWNGESHTVSFTIVYRGRPLSLVEQKEAVGNYLLGTAIGSEDSWNVRLPDIFINNTFFMVPMYHVTKSTPAGVFYPSISYPADIVSKMEQVAGPIASIGADPTIYAMTVAYKNFTVGFVKNDDNDAGELIDLYPTYRDFSPEEVGWSEMSSADREFSLKLNQALALAMGETNLLEHTVSSVAGLEYIVFTDKDTAFFVMKVSSFNSFFSV